MFILIFYWAILFAAYSAASKLRHRREKFTFLPYATMGTVYAIVLIMGMQMGANDQVTGQLQSIGLRALVITIACVGGSMLAVFGTRRIMGMDRYGNLRGRAEEPLREAPGNKNQEDKDRSKSQMHGELKSTLSILGFVLVGSLFGIFLLRKQSADFLSDFSEISGTATEILLYIMIALVGFDLGLSGKIAGYLKAVGIRALAFPFAAIAGSLVMGAPAACLLGFSAKEGLAISAGFGWYTYAPAVITNAGPEYAAAGAVAFLCNMIRETASIVLIPTAARRVGYLEAASMPGISSMDICLPIIEHSCRQDTVVYAFLIGFMMSIAASVGVPLVMQL